MQLIGSARGSCVNGTPALTPWLGGIALRSLNFNNCSVSKKIQNHRSTNAKIGFHAIAITPRLCWHQVATIGLGNDQRFENYRSRFPRYTSIQGNVMQTLQVGGGMPLETWLLLSRALHRKYRCFPPHSSSGDGKSVPCSAPRSVPCFLSSR